MKPHECWALLLIVIIYTQVQMNASSKLEMPSASMAGGGHGPVAAQAATPPVIAADSEGEHGRCHEVDLTKLLAGLREMEIKQKETRRRSQNSRKPSK